MEHNNNCIANGYLQGSSSQNIQVLYAKVRKELKPSSKDTEASVCEDQYELVDVLRCGDLDKTVKDYEFAPEPTTTRTLSSHGTLSKRNEFVHGSKEDDEYETHETVIDMRSVECVKAYDDGYTMAIQDEEPIE